MPTDALLSPSRLYRGPITRGIDTRELAASRISDTGGAFGAGLIKGVAVITRGEALGHGEWIDKFMVGQVADAINDAPQGIKSRFAHPGMSGDGIGKALGRFRDARVDGDIARADLHLFQTAHEAPDGDLAGYVLSLAKEDPEAFATSIAFDVDEDAMIAFTDSNRSKDGAFKSPDKDNTENYPHVRLRELTATDVVDEPAANPGGLFDRSTGYIEGLLSEADEVWTWLLGRKEFCVYGGVFRDRLGVHHDRIRENFHRYLERHGLKIVNVRAQRARAREVELDNDWRTQAANNGWIPRVVGLGK